MALYKQNVPLPLGQGSDTKTAPELVPFGKLHRLVNCQLLKTGEISKRFGGTEITDSNSFGSSTKTIEKLMRTNGQLLAVCDYSQATEHIVPKDRMFSYSPSSGATSWKHITGVTSPKCKLTSVYQSSSSQRQYAVGTVGNITAHLFDDFDSATMILKVIDNTTGAVINQFTDTSFVGASFKGTQIVNLNNNMYAFYANAGDNKVYAIQINGTTGALSGRQQMVSDFSNAFDIVSDTNRVCIIYRGSAAGAVKCLTWNDSGSPIITGSLTVNAPAIHALTIGEVITGVDPAPIAIGLAPSTQPGSGFIICWGTAAALRTQWIQQDLTPIGAPYNVVGVATTRFPCIIPSTDTSTLAYIFYFTAGTLSYDDNVTLARVNNAAVLNLGVIARSVSICAKPFKYNRAIHLPVTYESPTQSTHFILQMDCLNTGYRYYPIAKWGTGRAAGARDGLSANRCYNLPLCPPITDGVLVPSCLAGQVTTNVGNFIYYLHPWELKITFDTDDSPYRQREIGKTSHVAGGFLGMFDGSYFCEHNFLLTPEKCVLTPSGGGGLTPSSVYSYLAIYEWIDSLGNTHRSGPGPAQTVTMGVGDTRVTLTATTLRMTCKQNAPSTITQPTGVNTPIPVPNLTIEIYRTQANGSNYYKATTYTVPQYNNITVDTINFVDNVADSALIGNEPLYTTGGILDNAAPPFCSIVAVHQERVFLAGVENPNEIWFSKKKVTGAPIEFSDLFTLEVESAGGDITAMASVGDALVVFKEKRIYLITGEGPNPLGTQGSFNQPRLISTELGCRNANSLSILPDGVMFVSKGEFHKINTGYQIEKIGFDMDYYTNPVIGGTNLDPVAAIPFEQLGHICFLYPGLDALIYSYIYRQWFKATNFAAVGAELYAPQLNSVEKLARINPAGSQILLEADYNGLYRDGSSDYGMQIVTGWISMAGIAGFKRLRKVAILGRYKSGHKMRVSISYDWNPTVVDTITFDPATAGFSPLLYGDSSLYEDAAVTSGSDRYEFVFRMPRQKMESVRFKIEDINQASPYSAFSIVGLVLECGIKQGIAKNLRPEATL